VSALLLAKLDNVSSVHHHRSARGDMSLLSIH
jgi:hypothetical protein